MQCLRDSTPLVAATDPIQPELLYRCPRCGTRYDSVLNMLPKPRPETGRPPSPYQRSVGYQGMRNQGIPAPAGPIEQLGRLVWIIGVLVVCVGLLVLWSIKQ